MTEVILNNGLTAKIDDEDAPKVLAYAWYAFQDQSGNWRVKTTASTESGLVNIHLARLILDTPVGSFVDHIDRDPLNNQRSNLRLATWIQNTWNRGPQQGSKTGLKGVRVQRDTGRFYAVITCKGVRTRIGTFASAEEAAFAYDAKAKELFGSFAYTNF